MSSLADRLAAASRDRSSGSASNGDAMSTMVERRGREEKKAENDYSELKSEVHNTLLQQLGPKLYDAELTQSELEHMVKGALQKVEGSFNDEAHLRRTIDKIVSRIGRRVDESSPMVDARLPDGSRVNAIVPPLSIDGSAL